MLCRNVALVVFGSVFLASCGGGGGEPSNGKSSPNAAPLETPASTQAVLANANSAIERLKATLNSGKPLKGNAILKDLETAQAAIADIEKQRVAANAGLTQVREVFDQLGTMATELQKEKALLQKDKEVLTDEKRKLENREATLTAQFYTAIAAIIMGALAYALKYPTERLDRQYKRLEIKLKALELQKVAAPEEVAPHPVTLLKRLRSIKLRPLTT